MKIDKENKKKFLIGGMAIVFVLIFLSYTTDTDQTRISVDSVDISKPVPFLEFIEIPSPKHTFNPDDTINISATVTNALHNGYDFKVKAWEEKIPGSEQLLVMESFTVPIHNYQTHTFSFQFHVPSEPGEYRYSIIPYYSVKNQSNFGKYDDGGSFTIEVLDTTPDTTATQSTTNTESVDETSENPVIDLEDETTKIVITLIALTLVLIVGIVIVKKRYD